MLGFCMFSNVVGIFCTFSDADFYFLRWWLHACMYVRYTCRRVCNIYIYYYCNLLYTMCVCVCMYVSPCMCVNDRLAWQSFWPAKPLMHHGQGKEEKAHQAASEVFDSILAWIHHRIDGVFLRPDSWHLLQYGVWYLLMVSIYGINWMDMCIYINK